MHKRYLIFSILIFGAAVALAQTPQPISLQKQVLPNQKSAGAACADQFAGTIHFEDEFGNPITEDTFFLCFGETMLVVHNGDQNLTGDPNPGTQPGITYGMFVCPPTVSGPNLAAILNDPCILDNPPPTNGIYVTAGGSANGNITFNNSGALQNFFNGGNPLLLWFAPLTIDHFGPKQYELDPVTMEVGPCVNTNISEAFPVVYLNEIDATNLASNTGVSGCQGQFTVSGGLPQFDGSTYDIDISLVGEPTVKGHTLGSYTHGETVTYVVPVPGIYEITISDGKGCNHSFFANMSACVNISQSAQSLTVAPGDNICINITNEGGFIDLVSIQYAITWDPSVLMGTNVTNLTPFLPNLVPGSFNLTDDTLVFSWNDPAGIGRSLPDGTVLYQICFDVVGNDGACTDLTFVDIPGTGTEVVNENGSQLGFYGIPGQVCVSNTALVVDFTVDSTSCFDSSDGSVTVTVSGGQPPYSVTWQNTAGGPVQGPATINLDGGSFTVMNLTKGTYEVNVADSNDPPTVATELVSIPGPPVIDLLFNENPPLCNGDSGSIDAVVVVDSVIVNNPIQFFSFIWSTGDTTASISDIPSGAYQVTITDRVNGCSVEGGTFLPQPNPLNVLITIDSATCSGVGNGKIQVNVSGGSPDVNGNYTIRWPSIGPPPGLTITNNVSTLNGLESASYPLVVTDANGCTFEANIWLPARKVLSVIADIQPISCANVCSGSITLTGQTTSSTGEPPSLPYNFDWFGTPPPPPPSNETATTSTTTGLCPGVYTIVMQDASGCEIDTTFTLSAPPPIDINLVEAKNTSCTPGMDGSITVGVTGGTYPYTYTWNPSVTADSMATMLDAGTYGVTVTDANGCEDSLSVSIIQPLPPTITSLPNDTLACPESTNGTLTVSATPGDAPITLYSWSNSANGTTITGLGAGQYIVTVTDQNNCSDTDTAFVVAPAPLTIDSIVTSPPQCPGSGGGSITVFVSGGTGPYLFNWSTGLQGVGFNVLGGATITAGSYDVTITDANECEPITTSILLVDPPSIQVSFSAVDSVSCPNQLNNCDGTATASASYSNGNSGLFDFTWSSGETDNDLASSTATQLCAGVQYVVASDGICFDTFYVNIPAPPPIVPGQSITNVSCNGMSDGSVTLMPSGGTPPYTVTWQGNTQSPTLNNLSAGTYQAVITDARGCTFTHTVTINEPPVLDLTLNPAGTSDVSCAGDSDGIITVVAQGGNLGIGPPTYLWQNGIAPPSSNFASGLSPGTYSVTVVDVKGCRDSLTHTIQEPPAIQFSLGEIEPIQCAGGNTFLTVDSVWGGQPSTYQFTVDNGILRNLGAASPVFAGTHTITVIDVLNGCRVDTTIEITEPIPLSVILPSEIEVELGDTTTVLDPQIFSSLPIDSFSWNPPDYLSCSNCKNPIVVPLNSQLYTLTVTDVNGCTATAQVLVKLDRNRNVYIPNIFSPNNDGINDVFRIYTGAGVTNIRFMRIYNRWGDLVFEADNLPPSPDGTPGWDGRFKGRDLDPAVFMYLVEVEFLDGKVLLYRGDVTLMR